MPRIQPLHSHFSWGEMSPIMQGRTNLPQVQASCQALINWQVDSHGGIRRRLGTKYVSLTKYPELNARLIPFIFSREQSWVLEFGNYYIRFYRDGGIVVDPGPLRQYAGDGTSTGYFFPFTAAEVPPAEIEVYVDGVLQTITTDYTVVNNDAAGTTPTDNGLLGNVETWTTPAGFTPMTGVSNGPPQTFTAPANRLSTETAGIEEQFEVGIGSDLTYQDQIVAVTWDTTSVNYTSTPVQLLPDIGIEAEVLSGAMPSTDNAGQPVVVNMSFDVEDLSVTGRNFDFTWQLRLESGVVVDSGTGNSVTDPTITSNGNSIPSWVAGETLGIYVTVIAESNEQSVATVNDCSITVTGIYVNPSAKVHGALVDARGRLLIEATATPEVDASPVKRVIGEEVTAPAPWKVRYWVDYGVSVTFQDPKLWCDTPGQYIVFNSAPALGANIVIIQQGISQTDPARSQAAALADVDAYEIASPYSADEVGDIHFVQANDIMYLVHESHHPRTLSRYSAYDWRIEQPDFTGDPYDPGSNPSDLPAWTEASYDPLLGYPRTVTFFQQRLIFGGTESEPQTIWGSRVADFLIFAIPQPGVTQENDIPVKLTIAAQTQEAIQWLASSRAMFIGTTGNEHRVTVNSFLSVDNLPDVTRQSEYGSRNIQPEFIGTAVIFVQGSGREVRNYDLDRNANVEFYDSLNLAWLSEHITESGVVSLSYWRTPYSILFCTRADGVLLSMTFDPSVADLEEELLPVGWARHVTDGFFCCSAVIPADDHTVPGEYHQDRDEPWFIVRRDVGGVQQRLVEYMPTLNYLDSMINVVSETPAQSFSGADHLAGHTCDVLADGAVHPPVTVAGDGTFSLNYPAQDVRIGLRYTSYMKTSKWDQGNPSGSNQASNMRWSEIIARVHESAIPKINGQQPPLRYPSTPMNTAEPLFTGDVSVNNLGIDREAAIEIETYKPYACHLLGLFGQMGVNAG